MKTKDGSFVVLFKNHKRQQVFLVFRSDYPIWNLTGGGMEPTESPKQTAIREAFEETGFKVKIIKKLGIYEHLASNPNKTKYLSHLFEGRVISGTFKPEFASCQGRWFDINNLPVDITDKTKLKIIDAIHSDGNVFHKQVKQAQLINNLHLLIRHPLAALKYFFRPRG